jgi:hypothetical protein
MNVTILEPGLYMSTEFYYCSAEKKEHSFFGVSAKKSSLIKKCVTGRS